MNKNINSLLIRRVGKIWLCYSNFVSAIPEVPRLQQASTFTKEIQKLGYVLSAKAFKAVSLLKADEASDILSKVIETLREIKGVRRYTPMYPNFPEQVMNATDSELYLNALVHYWSVALADVSGLDLAWLPNYEKQPRPSLKEFTNLTVLDLTDHVEPHRIFYALVASNVAWSAQDKEDIEYLVQPSPSSSFVRVGILPDVIPNKENLAFLAGLPAYQSDVSLIQRYFKNATDVLRLAVAMSGGDVSLAAPTKFRNFKRSERRFLLALLDNIGYDSIVMDMQRWPKQWLRLGERLHPNEYKFYNAANAFTGIRKGTAPKTVASKVEKALADGSPDFAAALICDRPGELARRLDHMLRIGGSDKRIVGFFEKVASSVSTPVLLQVHAHFNNRCNPKDLRIFLPKGSIAKAKAIANNTLPISNDVCSRIVLACEAALQERFAELEPLGNVYIDERLGKCFVPAGLRSASKSLRTLVRGSRLPFGSSANTIRFFMWWKQGDTRCDLDLSAVSYDTNWKFKDQVSWTQLRGNRIRACHSGDITSAPHGACEFIDLDVDSVIQSGARYVVMSVFSFTGQDFASLPESFAGWMMRKDPKSGEIFEPSTVQDRFDVSHGGKVAIPLILDCVTREVIWADISLKGRPNFNSLEANAKGLALTGKAVAEMVKPNLYDLFSMHAIARGGMLVSSPESADTVFSMDQGVTPFNIEKIASEFMADAVKPTKPAKSTASAVD